MATTLAPAPRHDHDDHDDHDDPFDDVATALAQEAEQLAGRLDADRRLPAPLHEAAARHGLFRQLVPEHLGGRGDTPPAWFRRGVHLAWHEPSFGWVVTQGAAELAWIAAGGDPAWAAHVLGDPTATSASTTAGLGTLRIDGPTSTLAGTWSFNTGCQGATWLGGLAVVEDVAAPATGFALRMCWVPADRATVVEDWDATGLRGTGSHTITVAEQEIPTAWTIALFEPTANERGPHRCLVGNGNWPIAAAVAATQLGTARRALDEARRIVVGKAPAPTFTPLVDNAAVQRRLTELEGRWMAAHASVERELTSMWAEACADHQLSDRQRWRLATANATANQVAVEVVDGACELTGTAVAPRGSKLSRCLRDAHTLRGHIATGGTVLERAAQVSFDRLPPDMLV